MRRSRPRGLDGVGKSNGDAVAYVEALGSKPVRNAVGKRREFRVADLTSVGIGDGEPVRLLGRDLPEARVLLSYFSGRGHPEPRRE